MRQIASEVMAASTNSSLDTYSSVLYPITDNKRPKAPRISRLSSITATTLRFVGIDSWSARPGWRTPGGCGRLEYRLQPGTPVGAFICASSNARLAILSHAVVEPGQT